MKNFLLHVFIFMALTGSVVNAQTAYNMGGNATGTISNACGGTFYDSGGPTGNYQAGESDSVTFCAPAGQYISFNFTSFSTEQFFDEFYIYNGPNSSYQLIGNYDGTSTPPTIYSTLGGCLTFVFFSDASSTGDPGWAANITCSTTPPPPPAPGAACSTANPFCTSQSYTFPNSTSDPNGMGPINCLGSTPNPIWYFMQIGTAGTVVIHIVQDGAGGPTDSLDVDFNCFGPFTDMTTGCAAINANTAPSADCSYSANATEYCTITNAIVGQYYALLLTNFSNMPGTISFNSTNASTGATNCNIINCGVTAANTGAYCVGGTISLNATTTNTTATTYAWAGPGGYTATGQNVTIPNATLAMSGTYSVTGTTGGTVTCVETTTVIVATSATPTVTSATICAGSTGTLTATPAAASYTWNTGATTATMTASPTTTTVYSVTGAIGTCTAAATGTLTVVTYTSTATPTVSPTTICAGSTGTLTATGAATSYTWSTGATTPTMTDNPAITTSYTVTGSVGTCTAAATTTITVVANPTITVSTGSICNGNSATLTATSTTPGTTYTWSPATGLNNPNTATVVANPSVTTTYTINGTAGTCTATPVTTTVAVVAAATPTLTSNMPCATQTLNLTCTPTYTNYAWSGPGGFTSAVQNPTKSPILNSGTYTLVATDANGCVNTATVNAVVIPSPFVTGSASAACLNNPISLAATPTTYTNYVWLCPNGSTLTGPNPQILSAALTDAGVYHIVVTDNNGCIGAGTVTVTVFTPPTITVNDTTVCLLTPGTLIASSTNAGTTYNWNPQGDLNNNTGNPVVVTPSSLTTIIYTVTGQDANGCVNKAFATVAVNPPPTVSILPVLAQGCTPQCVTYTPNITNANDYSWSFGNGQTSILASPTACFSIAGTYAVKLTLTDANHIQAR